MEKSGCIVKAEERTRQVPHEMELIRGRVTALEDATASLVQTLQPVLFVNEADKMQAQPEDPKFCSLASEIVAIGDRVLNVSERIRYLNENLEI